MINMIMVEIFIIKPLEIRATTITADENAIGSIKES